MIKKIVSLCMIVILGLGAWTQAQETGVVTEPDASHDPVSVKMGLYLYDIGNFDYINRDFSAKLRYWYLYDQDADITPEDYTEFASVKSIEHESSSVEIKADKKRVVGLIQGSFHHERNPQTFPFDRQTLSIPIENEFYDTSLMSLHIDTKGTKIRESINFGDWKLISFNVTKDISSYHSTFGDPDPSVDMVGYDIVQADIELERETPILLFVKIFLASYLAVIAIYLSHLIPQDQVSARFGMSTAALFAAIGNHYVINDHIPSVASFTLVDGVQLLIISFIIISVIFTIFSTIEFEEGDTRDPWDKFLLRYGLIVFILLNVGFIYFMLHMHG